MTQICDAPIATSSHPGAKPDRLRVLDTPVDCVNMEAALEFVNQHVANATSPGTILAVNPEKVYALRGNPFLKEFFESAALLIPDGIGMVVALRFLYGRKVSRVPGADLMQKICAVAPERGYRIFIYGAAETVNREAVEILRQKHEGIQIVGRANGYVKAENMDALVQEINSSLADILFVALGSPRQEEWMHRYLPRLNIKLCQGIGGTLDTITGAVDRAPRAFQAVGLEWFYRLLRQPGRVRRQTNLVRFIAEVFRAKLRSLV